MFLCYFNIMCKSVEILLKKVFDNVIGMYKHNCKLCNLPQYTTLKQYTKGNVVYINPSCPYVMSRTPWLNQTSTHSFVYVICICIYTGTKFVTNLHSWILYCLVCFLLDIGTRTILLYCYTLLVICICWGCHCHIHLCLQRFKGCLPYATKQQCQDTCNLN